MLQELPAPPPGKAGWPWTTECLPLAPRRADGSAWPKITLVTPVLDQGSSIEAAIRSVLLQNYPNLEYFIFDGGSHDETVAIIQKYARWITEWASEPDGGPETAIRKALTRAQGVVFNWLKPDDYLSPAALSEVGRLWAAKNPHLVAGRCLFVSRETGLVLSRLKPEPRHLVLAQPSTFVDTALLREMNGTSDLYKRLSERFHGELKVATTPQMMAVSPQ